MIITKSKLNAGTLLFRLGDGCFQNMRQGLFCRGEPSQLCEPAGLNTTKETQRVSFKVGAEGLEPSLTYCERDFESSASTDSATPPHSQYFAIFKYPLLACNATKMLLFFC